MPFNVRSTWVSYHGLIEENQIHHGIALVELLQFGVQNRFELRRVGDGDVGIGGTLPTEGCEYHRLLEHLHLYIVRQGFIQWKTSIGSGSFRASVLYRCI